MSASLPESSKAQTAYLQPELYDLEHAGAEGDVAFFLELAKSWRPRRTLEIGCGNGRVTNQLAEAAAVWNGAVTGIDTAPEMLNVARERDVAARVTWIEADLTKFTSEEKFDLIISPCGSLSHLVELEKQLQAWRVTYDNLAAGGRFVISEPMANLTLLAESMHFPPRATVELDLDRELDEQRLVRYRATSYHAHDQKVMVHYLYDRFAGSDAADRLVGSYVGHVYFPNELKLLAVASGFSVEAAWGDHQQRSLQHTSRSMVLVCRREV